MNLSISIFIFIGVLNSAQAGRIRLRPVKEPPRTCAVMKEDLYLSRSEKKILGTLKNSLVFDSNVSLIGDLGHKICEWPIAKFTQLNADPKNLSFYIDEFKNILIAYKISSATASRATSKVVNQVQINIENCEFESLKTLTDVSVPKCVQPKKSRRKKARQKTA